MSEIVFLGVGGAMPLSPAYNHTALVVRDDDATILLDCGPGIMRQLELAGISYADLTHVFVSHQHGDHSLGLPMLLLHRVLFYPDRPLRVLAAPTVLDALNQLNTLAYPDLRAHMEESSVECLALDTGGEDNPLPGAHKLLYRLAPGRHTVPMWGIRLALDGGPSVVYSGDTGPCRSMAELAAGADLLAHDAFYLQESRDSELHSTAEQVGELAEEAGVRTVALLHRKDTGVAAAGQYQAAAARRFAGEILAPQAGDRLTLPIAAPRGAGGST